MKTVTTDTFANKLKKLDTKAMECGEYCLQLNELRKYLAANSSPDRLVWNDFEQLC